MNEATDLLPLVESPLAQVGYAADERARENLLSNYQQQLTKETLRRHHADLALFRRYLIETTTVDPGDLFTDITAWQGITWGLVYHFPSWMLTQHYAIGSVNVRLSTVKKYVSIAHDSQVLALDVAYKVGKIKLLNEKAGRNIDEKRGEGNTRTGTKKAKPTLITISHLQALRTKLIQDDTYLGRRDLLLLCLLGYHGMRASEIHDLERGNVSLAENKITFYRRKVYITDTHEMGKITLMVMLNYLRTIPPTQNKLFLGVDRAEWIDKQGKVHVASHAEDGLSTRAINQRVREFGEMVGVPGLSPHDLRHACIDDLAKNGTPIEILKKVGGWKTYAMPEHYTRKADITNKGIKQSQW
jgi:integrase